MLKTTDDFDYQRKHGRTLNKFTIQQNNFFEDPVDATYKYIYF